MEFWTRSRLPPVISVIYKIAIQLTAKPKNEPGRKQYAAYLDRIAGKGMWGFCDAAPNPEAFDHVILGPEMTLMKLKWADIGDGIRRVTKEKALESAELAHYRQLCGGAFPWE
jgi:hypothetical protein